VPRTIFDITADMQAIEDALIEAGGDITDPGVAETIDAWMAEIGGDLKAKVDAYATLIREIESRAVARAEESKRLAGRAKVDEKAADGLKARLLLALQTMNVKTLDTDHFKVSIATNGGKTPLNVLNTEAIPAEFRRQVVTEKIDNDAIRAALESGAEVPGVSLGERGFNLRIR
jgi:hypothetical protein